MGGKQRRPVPQSHSPADRVSPQVVQDLGDNSVIGESLKAAYAPPPAAAPMVIPPGKGLSLSDALSTLGVIRVSLAGQNAQLTELSALIRALKGAEQASRLLGVSQAKSLDSFSSHSRDVADQMQHTQRDAARGKTEHNDSLLFKEIGVVNSSLAYEGKTWGDWTKWASNIPHSHHRELFTRDVLPVVFGWAVPLLEARNTVTSSTATTMLGGGSGTAQSHMIGFSLMVFRTLATEAAARFPRSSAFDSVRFGDQLGQVSTSNSKVQNNAMIGPRKGVATSPAFAKMVEQVPKAIGFNDPAGWIDEHIAPVVRRLTNERLGQLIREGIAHPDGKGAQKAAVLRQLGVNVKALGVAK